MKNFLGMFYVVLGGVMTILDMVVATGHGDSTGLIIMAIGNVLIFMPSERK